MKKFLLSVLFTSFFALASEANYHDEPTKVPDSVAYQIESGNYSGAIVHLKRLIKTNPNNAKLEEVLGEILLISNRPNEAIEHLLKAEKLTPPDSDAGHKDNIYLSIGIAYYIAGNVIQSEKYFTRITNAPHEVSKKKHETCPQLPWLAKRTNPTIRRGTQALRNLCHTI